MRPVLSLFSGCGGLDLGFEDAGFVVPLAVDNSKPAVDSYNRNRPSSPALQIDLAVSTVESLVRDWEARTTLSPVGVIGGPPCQAFSRANYRQSDEDPRRLLPKKYAELLAGLVSHYPSIQFFVFENVTGLLSARHAAYMSELIAAFSSAGFEELNALKLDAADFGVPQHRTRVFLVGLRNSTNQYTAPRPDCAATTVRQAIGHLPEPLTYAQAREHGRDESYHVNHWCMTPRSPRFTQNRDVPGRAVGRSFRRLSWDTQSWTVSYGHREVHVHPRGHRRLSVLEALLIQGFPESYELAGTLSDQFRMVSDAVAPPVAQAVARSLQRWLVPQSSSNGQLGQRGRLGRQTKAPKSTKA